MIKNIKSKYYKRGQKFNKLIKILRFKKKKKLSKNNNKFYKKKKI